MTGGQVPRDPTALDIPNNIEDQTRQRMENLKTVVEAAGGRMSDFIRITVYLTDMKNWASMNDDYRKYINEEKPPARLFCGVGLNAENQVDIDGIAVSDREGRKPAEMTREYEFVDHPSGRFATIVHAGLRRDSWLLKSGTRQLPSVNAFQRASPSAKCNGVIVLDLKPQPLSGDKSLERIAGILKQSSPRGLLRRGDRTGQG